MIDFVLPPLYHSGNLEGIQIELKVINELMKKHNKRLFHNLRVNIDQILSGLFNIIRIFSG